MIANTANFILINLAISDNVNKDPYLYPSPLLLCCCQGEGEGMSFFSCCSSHAIIKEGGDSKTDGKGMLFIVIFLCCYQDGGEDKAHYHGYIILVISILED